MPDYSKGKIYTIRCLNDPNVYVGSTIQSLAVRMGGHRKHYYKNNVLGKNKEIVKDINEWKIELHEVYPCLTKQELHRREGEVIREIGTLNKRIAGRTDKEWRTDHKEEIKEYAKQYRTDHKEQIKESKRQYRTDHKEQIKESKRQYSIKLKLANTLKNNEIKMSITE